jgi:hypothetical protein
MRTALFRDECGDGSLLSCLLLSCFRVKQVQKSRPRTVELTQISEFTTRCTASVGTLFIVQDCREFKPIASTELY